LGHHKALLDQLVDLVTKAHGAVAAVIGLVGFAIAGIRWAQRRRHPPALGFAKPVKFSGRTRKAFIDRVWSQRIVNGLDRSLQHAAEMHLGMRNAPELVKLTYAQSTAEPGEVLGIGSAFEQAGGQLLITGPPGSGKTTEALKLMRHLLKVARRDPSAPIPELFPLASWAKERKPIIEWLAEQLQLRHGRPLSEARSLVWDHRVVPFLDGLDEVAAEHRPKCLQEINRFWESHRGGPLVLCSRPTEYEELPERVKFGGAVTVCQPEAQQIDEYLAAAGSRWDPVRAELRAGSSPYLRELLATPLMLSIAVLAYLDDDPSELCEAHDAEGQREALWSQYVSAVTTRGYNPDQRDPADTPAPYTEEEVRRWLGWLASEMRARNETELWLHEWSGPRSFRRKVRIGAGIVLGLAYTLITFGLGFPLFLALIGGLSWGLITGLLFVLGGERVLKPEPAYRVPFNRRRLAVSAVMGALGGVLLGLGFHLHARAGQAVIGLAVGLLFVLAGTQSIRPELGYRLASNPQLALYLVIAIIALVTGLLVGHAGPFIGALVVGILVGRLLRPEPDYRQLLNFRTAASFVARLIVGLIIVLTYGLIHYLIVNPVHRLTNEAANGLVADLLVGLLVGLFIGLFGGLVFGLVNFGPDRERVAPRSPTQLIADSGRIGLLVGLVVGLVVGFLFGLTGVPPGTLVVGRLVSAGLFIGLFIGLMAGLDSVLYYFAFRLWLRLHRNGPLGWVRFLEWARVRLLLRSTGAAYEWAHLELRDYMATQYGSTPDPTSRTTSRLRRAARQRRPGTQA
jgi:MFS family permease